MNERKIVDLGIKVCGRALLVEIEAGETWAQEEARMEVFAWLSSMVREQQNLLVSPPRLRPLHGPD